MSLIAKVVLKDCFSCMHRRYYAFVYSPKDEFDKCFCHHKDIRSRKLRKDLKIPMWCPLRHGSFYN